MPVIAQNNQQVSAIPAFTPAAVTTSQIFTQSLNGVVSATVPFQVNVPGSLIFNKKYFGIQANGSVTTAGAYTALPTLFAGAAGAACSVTPGSNTIIKAGTARSVSTTTAPWMFRAEFYYDSTSGLLHGQSEIATNLLYDVWATNTNAISGLTSSTAEPLVQFCIGITFGTGNIANTATLGAFYAFSD